MSLSRYAKKRDTAEPAIIAALRATGCRVWQLDRPFDLLVGYHGRFVVLEVKTGSRQPHGEQARALEDARAGGLPVYVVRSVEEALHAVRGDF